MLGIRADGPHVALDCEFVGTGPGGYEHGLARVSIVDAAGRIILDTFCTPRQPIVDYRTPVSGIRPESLQGAPSFDQVRERVVALLWGRILVGHAIQNDLSVLDIDHPPHAIRDTQHYEPLQRLVGKPLPSLRQLAKVVLNLDIQQTEHDSVEDARATMNIFHVFARQWEASLMIHRNRQTFSRSPPPPYNYNPTGPYRPVTLTPPNGAFFHSHGRSNSWASTNSSPPSPSPSILPLGRMFSPSPPPTSGPRRYSTPEKSPLSDPKSKEDYPPITPPSYSSPKRTPKGSTIPMTVVESPKANPKRRRTRSRRSRASLTAMVEA